MNNSFSRNMTLLRKERKLSQKEAANELGISQALLSHYEKGIRECGLDFAVRAAEFYNVSCDYLLGRTTERSLDISELSDSGSRGQNTGNIISKRLISASLNIIYDQLSKTGQRRLTRSVTSYLMSGIYKVFRYIYSENKNNPTDLFTVPQSMYKGYSNAVQEKLFAEIEYMSEYSGEMTGTGLSQLNMSPDSLANEYPNEAAAMFNLIQQAESSINKNLRR